MYNKIFVPFTDIYEQGGPEVFKELSDKKDKKNLVVFPSSFGDRLSNENKDFKFGGGLDVLHYLKNLKHFEKENKSDFIIYKVSNGLDIAYIDHKKVFKDKQFSISGLDKKIKDVFDKISPRLISTNPNDHIKFGSRGMKVEDPNFLLVNEEIVDRWVIEGNDKLLAKLYSNQEEGLDIDNVSNFIERKPLFNQFIRFLDKNHGQYVYAKIDGDLEWNKTKTRIVDVVNQKLKLFSEQEYGLGLSIKNHHLKKGVSGIYPRNMEQYIALQYGILNPDISLVFIAGSQGSGKTLISYASAIDSILYYNEDIMKKRGLIFSKGEKKRAFEQILLLKSNDIMGGQRRNIGYLPGTMYEKIQYSISPFVDAHDETNLTNTHGFDDLLRHPKRNNDFGEPIGFKDLPDGGHLTTKNEPIQVVYSAFMRGRSFKNRFFLIDEGQNYTPYEMKTIIERAGEGSKIVIIGDPAQFDNPDCSRQINGFTYAMKHFMDKPYCTCVALNENFRRQMSEDSKSMKVYSK